ncbi:MAG: carbon-phosphorus lyase complex subunit PhnI, partial [Coriobacteriales bacterium]|nr:carbon-phosphorus lyase complex subunit PhnI [Coriobacteriales bacterium]
LSLQLIVQALPELVDQVMAEASLYDPELAALALKQGAGSVEEAVFLLRAFRSTLERPYVSRVINTAEMRVERRISAAFQDIAGGQILGMTRDYSHRLLDFSLADAGDATAADPASDASAPATPAPVGDSFTGFSGIAALPKVSSYLAEQGLYIPPVPDDTQPCDITMEPLSFPSPRSARLQILARGMTQAVMALGYAAIRGFGPAHPTVGELRQGRLPVYIDRPFSPGDAEDAYYVGSLAVTEVESLFGSEQARPSPDEDASAPDADAAPPPPESAPEPQHELGFEIGYGLVYGRSESKAIAMSVLDYCLSQGDARYPTQDEEFVLYHVDGVEATGFLSHLKLPHYVTFQSKLSSTRGTRAQEAAPQHKGEEHKEERRGEREHKGDVLFCVPDKSPCDQTDLAEHKRVRPLCAPAPLCAPPCAPPAPPAPPAPTTPEEASDDASAL